MKNLKNPYKIPHSKPTISNTDIKSVSGQVVSGMHATGSKTREFEEKFSKYVGVRYGKAVNSGINAAYLALLALGIKKGDEVIIPSYVCQALLNAVNYTGAKPVIADIRADFLNGCNLSIETIKPLITKKTKAIILPHMFGIAADIRKIVRLGIPVIEDSAQSLGGEVLKGKKMGSFGHIGIFSFYATKLITTGQGGMIVTNSKKIKEKLDDLTQYDLREKYKIAYNFGMTDIQSSLGISQLSHLNDFIRLRKGIAKKYDNVFSRLPIGLLNFPNGAVPFRYVLKLETEKQLKNLQKFLNKNNIISERPVFKPIHKYLGLNPLRFQNTELAYRTMLSIPIYPSLKKDEINRVIGSVQKFFKKDI